MEQLMLVVEVVAQVTGLTLHLEVIQELEMVELAEVVMAAI
jgi:hypothetical protein